MARRRPYDDIPNLGYRGPDGGLVLNPLGPTVNVDELPFSDYSIFEPDRFYRPAYVGPSGWIGVRLDRDVDWDEIKGIVEDAYRLKAPRQLVKRLNPGALDHS